jgi:hypothetical protein
MALICEFRVYIYPQHGPWNSSTHSYNLKCPDPRHAVIQFEGKEERNVPTRLVIAMSGAIPWPMLRVYIYSKFTY